TAEPSQEPAGSRSDRPQRRIPGSIVSRGCAGPASWPYSQQIGTFVVRRHSDESPDIHRTRVAQIVDAHKRPITIGSFQPLLQGRTDDHPHGAADRRARADDVALDLA